MNESRSLELALHAWRSFGPDEQPDLYFWRWRLGFMTVTMCRVCVLAAYQDAKAEARRLRETLNRALSIGGGDHGPPT